MDDWEEEYRRLQEHLTGSTGDETLQGSTGYQPKTLWDRLAAEGHHALIEKLHRAEKKDPGYNVLLVPTEGYSDDDITHNAIVDWIKEKDILSLNVTHEIACLDKALHHPRECKY